MAEELRNISKEELDQLVTTPPQLERAPFTKALIQAFRDSTDAIYTRGWSHRSSGDDIINEGIYFLGSPKLTEAECHATLEIIFGGSRTSLRSFVPTPNRVAAILEVNPVALRQIGYRELDRLNNIMEVSAEDELGTRGFIRVDGLKLFFPISPSRKWLFYLLTELQKNTEGFDAKMVDSSLANDLRMI